MENLCRLCAVEKSPKELIYSIDDELLNIEQKLIACCRWSLFLGDVNHEFTRRICIDCFQKLEQSWEFAETIAQAQQTFYTFTIDVKPFLLLHIEQTDCSLNEEKYDKKEEIHEIFDSNDRSSSPETCFTDILPQQCSYENSMKCSNDAMQQSSKCSVEKITDSKLNFDLLAVLSDSDRNSDGTVNGTKIAELNLDDWSIVKWNCWICNEIFDKYRILRSHFRRNHSDKTFRLQCALCNAKYTKRHSIHSHIINNHRSYLKFCCEKCNLFYWDVNALKKHMSGSHMNQHRELDALCEICGKNFPNQWNLRSHARLHLPIEQRRTFECYICKINFAYKKSLNQHMRSHSGLKVQFNCDICQSKFSRSDSLRRHSLIHSGKLPHSCQYCKKGFRTKFNLKVHERTHTGEKPYHCMYCNYRSSDGPNLGKHIKQKHKIGARHSDLHPLGIN